MLAPLLFFKISESPAGASEGQWEEPMLVACRWFDREMAGYIAGEDLEEIAFMVSDGMSSQSHPHQPFGNKFHSLLHSAIDAPFSPIMHGDNLQIYLHYTSSIDVNSHCVDNSGI